MKKRLLVGATISLALSLGLWLGFGSSAAANSRSSGHAKVAVHVAKTARIAVVHVAKTKTTAHRAVHRTGPARDSSGTDAETPESTSEGESSTTETNGVDCQQDGNFEGVN